MDEADAISPEAQVQHARSFLGRRGGNVFYEAFSPPMLDASRVREPERALASGIPAIRALGNMGMMSPTLCPEEILVDHPERLRAVIVEGANPYLSYSDAARWREARKQLELLVVIDPAMTETARDADYVLPTPVGYEKWEIAGFPKGFPEVFVQLRGEAGARQVPDAAIALTHNNSGMGEHVVMVYGKEPA